DHPDGLWNPARYFRQLQEGYVLARVRAKLPPGDVPDGLGEEVEARFAARFGDSQRPVTPWPLYVVAEKILAGGEPLPPGWAVDGTTGYDFLNSAGGLFVAGDAREAFDRIYHEFTKCPAGYHQLVNSTKKMIMLVSMASEVNALALQLDRI